MQRLNPRRLLSLVVLLCILNMAIGSVLLPQTSASAASLHDAIRIALLNVEAQVDLSAFRVNSEQAFAAWRTIIDETPAIFYSRGVSFWSNGVLEFKYQYPREEIRTMQRALDLRVKAIISELIAPGQSELEKVLAFHDFLVLNVEYDLERLQAGIMPDISYTAYGALLDGIAVCSGYAAAFKLLLDSVGVEALVVKGNARNELHAWNLVKIDDSYYHIDVTWNDPIPDRPGSVSYSFFGMTDSAISRTHSWSGAYPAASSNRFAFLHDARDAVRGGDFFYYTLNQGAQQGLFRSELNGSNTTRLNGDQAASLAVHKGWLYYSSLHQGGRIYRLRTDGSQKQLLHAEAARNIRVTDNWVFFTDWEGHTLFRMRHSGTEKSAFNVRGGYTGPRSFVLEAAGSPVQLPAASSGLVWASSNTQVAIIDHGQLIPVQEGVSIVSLVAGDLELARVVVAVLEPLPALQTEILLTIGRQVARVNGVERSLPAAPYIQPGTDRTLVPVRFVSENLGAFVQWLPATRQVLIRDQGKEILLTVGSRQALVNGRVVQLDCAPEITADSTFVPLRFVSETLGAGVHYMPLTSQISVTR